MPIRPFIEPGRTTPAAEPRTNTCRASILAMLLGPESASAVFAECTTHCTSSGDSVPATDTSEPELPGLYRDRDGDIWLKTDNGWRLCKQHGVAVDDTSLWEWMGGHVRDYGPFVPLTTE